MTLVDVLISAARTNRAGITFLRSNGEEEKCTYRSLYERALLVLGTLQQKGLQPGNELVILVEDNQDLLSIFWGCILGRIIPVPMSVGAQPEQKLKIFTSWKYLSHSFWVSTEQQADRLQKAAIAAGLEVEYAQIKERYISLDSIVAGSEQGALATCSAGDLAYIQFSSGSTGEPKGVCLTHDNLVYNIRDIIQSIGITGNDVLLSWMPLTHDMGLIGFHLTALMQNIDAVSIPTASFIRRPLLWLEKASACHASVLYSPNFGFQYFLSAFDKQKKYSWDLSGIRVIINGAEPVSAALCKQFTGALKTYGLNEHAIVVAYGLAEAAVEVACTPIGAGLECYYLNRNHLNIGDEVHMVNEDAANAVPFVDAGYAVSACSVRIFNDQDEVLPDNTIGHILIKGKNVTAGYYNNPSATAALFASDQWLRTGDLGFLHNGRLIITGRLKNIIILNGQNYYAQDIERIIINAGLGELGKVVACGARDLHNDREELIVFIVHKGSEIAFKNTAKELRSLVLAGIGIYTDKVIAVRKIPKTTSGKVQHFMLLEQYRKGEYLLWDEAVTGRGELNREIFLQAVRDVLGAENIDWQSELWRNGLHSLQAMRLMATIQQVTGVHAPVSSIFEVNTVEDLYRYIHSLTWRVESPVRSELPGQQSFDLSLAQRRIWMECQLQENTTAYNIPVIYRVKGPLKIELLENSVRQLIHRYEILRTSFHFTETGPVQKVWEADEIEFSIKYINHIQDLQEAEVFCSAAINTPFRLDIASQLRLTVINYKEDEYLVVFCIHHLLADGWSLVKLFTELFELYNSQEKGIPLPVFAPPVQYREYVAWQREMMAAGRLEDQKEYWLNELRDLPEIPEPAGTENPAMTRDHYLYTYHKEDLEQLQQLARKYETTPFCIVMALLNTLVYRYTNVKDIVIGFDVMGRIAADIEQCVGYAINTLCLRTAIEPHQSFADLVKKIKAKVYSAIDNQLYPFELMLEDSRSTNEGRHSLFDTLVLYQQFYKEGIQGGIHNCEMDLQQGKLKDGFVDLLLEFVETNNSLELRIQYNSSLYKLVDVERFAHHLSNLLHLVAANDVLAISQYDFLTGGEKDLLLRLTASQNILPGSQETILQFFEEQVVETPDAVAVIAGEHAITYRELNNRSNAVAACIQRQAIVFPDDRIGFVVQRNENMIIAMLAILKTGAAYLPIDPQLPPGRIEYILKDSGSRFLLTDHENREIVQGLVEPAILVDLDEHSHFLATISDLPDKTDADNLAYVLYTSGSTGEPKGVMIAHKQVAAYVKQFVQYFSITARDIIIQQASVSFDTMVEEVFPALGSGSRLVIAKNGGRDIDELLALVHKHQVTVLSITPLLVNELNARADNHPGSLRAIISGGDVLYPSYIDRLLGKVSIYNTYGPVEATVCATYKQVRALEDAGAIGQPISGCGIYILDENGQSMPVGKTGEICIAGNLARGYLNNQELTHEKFVTGAWSGARRIYRSGDLGKVNEHGEIVFAGRKDHQVKVAGHRVELSEIEKAINSFQPVEECAVVWVGSQHLLVAFLTATTVIPVHQLRLHLSRFLPLYMLPHHFEVIEEMPLTASGKIDRQQLIKLAGSADQSVATDFNTLNDTEKQLQVLLKEVLGVENIGRVENIFMYGFNSLKAVHLIGLINKAMQCKVDLRDVFIHPTIELLASRMSQLEKSVYKHIDKVPLQTDYALSNAQQRLWLVNRLNENSFAYNEGELFEINGTLDVALVRKTFTILVQRHEVLRTTFKQINGIPRQVIKHDTVEVLNFLYEDATAWNNSNRSPMEMMAAQLQQPFDLENGPLYRIVLIKVAREKYLFTVIIHHIVTDDKSCSLLITEFRKVYAALRSNHPVNLPVLPVSYKDYVYWCNNYREKELYPKLKQYWLKVFEQGISKLKIPNSIKSGQTLQSGKRFLTGIDGSLLGDLHTYCHRQQITPFMLLVAGLGVLLARYTGQYQMVVGAPVSERDHPDLEPVAGCFVNMLPLLIRFQEDDPLYEVIRKVKQVCLDGYQHSAYPFNRLINDLRLSGEINEFPLIDVLINLNTSSNELMNPDASGISFQKLPKPVVAAKYALAFYFEEQDDQLQLLIEYDGGLYSERQVERMAVHFKNMLRSFIDDDKELVNRVSYLSEEERQGLLNNGINKKLPLPDKSIVDLFVQRAAMHPGKSALQSNSELLTYNELNDRSDALARQLIRHYKVVPGQPVCLLLDRSPNVVVAILAVWKAGAAYIPIDPFLPDKRIEYIIKDTATTLILTDLNNITRCELLSGYYDVRACCVDTLQCASRCTGCTPVPYRSSDLGYIMYTSGSTGEPKGAIVYQQSILNVICDLQQQLAVTSDAKMLAVSNYSFDISVTEFFLPLLCGGTLVLAGREEVQDLGLLKKRYEEVQPSLMQGTPALYNMLVELGWRGHKGLTAITCGEPLTEQLKTQLLQRTGSLWNLYGPTEATIFATGCCVQATEEVTIGYPLYNNYVLILDKAHQLAPAGVYGELYIGGKGVCQGYLNRPALTHEKFIRDSYTDQGIIYNTGDLARWTEDGKIGFSGRADTQVKLRGYRIELGEIESNLLQHENVLAAAVMPVGTNDNTQCLCAFIVFAKYYDEAETVLRILLQQRLPRYMIPEVFINVNEMPVTANGKTDRRALVQLGEQRLKKSQQGILMPAMTEMETQLLVLWNDILNQKEISITDNFFDLGGHSLQANQLLSKIQIETGIMLRLSDIFLHPTIIQMARIIAQKEREAFEYIEL